MAANTSQYMYLVGQQEFNEDGTLGQPWAVVLLVPWLEQAKEFIAKVAPDATLTNVDTKRNHYWCTERLQTPEGEIMLDIQKVRVGA